MQKLVTEGLFDYQESLQLKLNTDIEDLERVKLEKLQEFDTEMAQRRNILDEHLSAPLIPLLKIKADIDAKFKTIREALLICSEVKELKERRTCFIEKSLAYRDKL